MEQLIPFIIILLVGSFFSSKKKKAAEQAKEKPFTAQEQQIGTLGKLKEMYQELQNEMQPEIREREIQEAERMNIPVNPVAANRAPLKNAVPRAEDRTEVPKERSKRRSSAVRVKSEVLHPTGAKGIMPKNRDDIIKGIVFSEIFGPPISKR